MVARTRRDTGIGQADLRGDLRDDRLRAVAPGHREAVGTVGERRSNELFEVDPGNKLDRLDPAAPSLVREVETRRLAAAGARVVEQHGG